MIFKVELVSRVAALLVAAAWAGIVLSCIGGWIKECAVTQYIAFKKLSCFSRLAILILFGFYTYIGATKQCNPHFDHNSSALKEVCFTPQALLNSSSSESDNTTDSLTTNEVFITRFEKSDDGVEIDVDREMESSSSSAEISVFLSTNILASSEWSYATNATFAANQTNLTIAVSNADSSVLSSPQAFYAVGLNVDSDNDGLIDFLERHIYRTDPFNPDSDFDGIIDGEEVRRGLRPGASDSDSDGLDDGEEIGYITRSSSPLPWLDFVEAEDITSILSDHYSTLVSLPRELYIQNNTVTNAAVSRSGVILLNRKDHAGNTTSYSTELRNPVSLYSLVLAPYSDTTQVYLPDVPSHFDSSVKVGRAVLHNSEYVLFEFINMYRTLPTSTYASQAVSYQVAIPAANPTRAYIRYRGVSGEDMNGKYATVGFQSFGCKRTHIYCRNQNGAICNDLCLQFVLGTNTDPAKFDSDNDGLSDGYERIMRTDPTRPDTDMDGMPDMWELDYGLNPRSSDGDDGASGDVDQDGLTNLEEYENNANPQNADTDGDGVGDFDEVENALDPNSATDGGLNVSLDEILNMPFRIGGDFAAWTLLIDGLGPTDYRTFRFSKIYATGSYAQTGKRLRKGNKYRIKLKWLHCEGHEYDAGAPWYCWGLQLGERYLPRSTTYDSYSGMRLPDVANEIIGDGWVVDNRSGLLTSSLHEKEGGAGNVAEKLEAILCVWKVELNFCDPSAEGWPLLAEERVIMDDEPLRLKIRIEPAVASIEECKRLLGDSIQMKSSGTSPVGVLVPIDSSARFLTFHDYSEIRIEKSREELISYGLLPEADEDGISEMASIDMGVDDSTESSNLQDSRAFLLGLGYQRRGEANDSASENGLEQNPPISKPSESFFKAAGAETIMATYAGSASPKRQIMNQADVFYYSGHGLHKFALIDDYSPENIGDSWKKDMDCLIVAGCSVLDINDYNNNFMLDSEDHIASPGKLWEGKGPDYLLGYNYYAPLDMTGAPTSIINEWLRLRVSHGDVDAWMLANDNRYGRNACAIEKGVRYCYFKKQRFHRYKLVTVNKEDW